MFILTMVSVKVWLTNLDESSGRVSGRSEDFKNWPQEGLTTVFSHLKDAEHDVLYAVIINTSKQFENRDLKCIAITIIIGVYLFPLKVYRAHYGCKMFAIIVLVVI